MPIPGFDSENVFLVREPAEANRIAELANEKKVVVIGTSFIGESGTRVIAVLLRGVCGFPSRDGGSSVFE